MRHFLLFLIPLFLCIPAHSSGYLGAGHSINSSATFDEQNNGLRIDWGASVTSNLDLEWSYVDFGASNYDRPTYVSAADAANEPDNDDDTARYDNLGFGSVRRTGDEVTYRGIDNLHAKGVSAGLKFKINANAWLQLYARASLLVWQATTETIELSDERVAVIQTEDDEGNLLDTPITTNLNECGNLLECQQEGKTFNAVDFWYGYGFIAKPMEWLAIRAEYSIITLNAIDFPHSTLEGLNTSLEIHF